MGSATFEWDRAGKVWDKQHVSVIEQGKYGITTSECDRGGKVWDQQHLSVIEQPDK